VKNLPSFLVVFRLLHYFLEILEHFGDVVFAGLSVGVINA
jgi:hypothetical protein